MTKKILDFLVLLGWCMTEFFLTVGTINMLHEGDKFGVAMLIALIGFWIMSIAVTTKKRIRKQNDRKNDEE